MIQSRFEHDTEQVWAWYRAGLGKIQSRFEHDTEQVWAWYRAGLGMIKHKKSTTADANCSHTHNIIPFMVPGRSGSTIHLYCRSCCKIKESWEMKEELNQKLLMFLLSRVLKIFKQPMTEQWHPCWLTTILIVKSLGSLRESEGTYIVI